MLQLPTSWRNRPTLRALPLAAALFALVALLSATTDWRLTEHKLFDLFTIAAATGESELPIFMVAIDDQSLAEVGMRWPWPRSLHARLVNKLREAGAGVVAFDVVFDYPTETAEDNAFATAIERAGNVVLAAGLSQQETDSGTFWIRKDPLPLFVEHGAAVGFANLEMDRDLVLRRIPPERDALWQVIIDRLQQRMPDFAFSRALPEGGLVRFTGPGGTFPRIPFHQALALEQWIEPGELEGALVIVARDTHSAADIGAAQSDLFATPFTLTSAQLMAGGEIHASILESVIGETVIAPLSRGVELALLALVTLLATLATANFRPLRSALLALTLAGATTALSWLLFLHAALWLPVLGALLSIALIHGARALHAVVIERRQRERIKRMFAHYVPAEVVERLADDAAGLRLGGETREVTMMFTDLEGFTQISESLDPETVTELLNNYLTAMNQIIFDEGGTIDKFIGDAIMAFWNAPLEHADHAQRAVRAAIRMQQALAELREGYQREGLPPLRMRIGLHTGPALVGNMGSLIGRVNYTAIGDSVNLAARLEGVNKLYGSEILISGESAERVREQVMLRRVDRVRVKGKREAIDIFTPCDDARLVELSERGFEAYRRRRWEEAEALYRELPEEEGVARRMREHITEMRTTALEEGWSGETTLTTK